jgi:isopentenyldiphosphate isomerase
VEESHYRIPLVDDSGGRIGYGDRWWTHRVRRGAEGPVLGQKHVGITIACLDDDGRILLQHRRHRIFDDVWSLSGDTHPRKYGDRKVETLRQASTRCALEDWGVRIRSWTQAVNLSYRARDPRNPRYCENELLYVLVSRNSGPVHMNRKNAYGSRWAEISDIARDSRNDMRKRPRNRKYAPWVHTLFSLPPQKIYAALHVG